MKFDLSRSSRRLCILLIALDILFVVLHLIFGQELDLFHLDRERNFPSYYSGLKLISIASLAAALFLLSKGKEKIMWGGFIFLFIFLSFDEISELHENVTYYAVKAMSFSLPYIFRSPTHNWLFLFSPFIVATLIFFGYCVYRVRALNREIQGFLLSGFLLFITAVFLEFVGGILVVPSYYKFLAVIEEFVEMVGATLVFTALFELARTSFSTLYHRIDQCQNRNS